MLNKIAKQYRLTVIDLWNNYLESFVSTVIIGLILFRFFIIYSQEKEIVLIAIFNIIFTCLFCYFGKIKLSDLKFFVIGLLINYSLDTLKLWEYQKPEFFNLVFGTQIQSGYIDFLKLPILVICLSVSCSRSVLNTFNGLNKYLSNIFKLNSKKLLYFNIFTSCCLSLYYVVITYLKHLSFGTAAIDYGIFDQAIFLLSRGQYPTSSVQQFTNLFFDHQHFSMVILAPLYWLNRGFNGTSLIFITPFLLITFPAITLYLAAREFATKILKIKFNYEWIITLGSFILFYHPFTQSAISFYFHEKYLIPVFFSSLIFSLIKGLTTKNKLWFVYAYFITLFWIGTKEDQWIFVLVFLIQITFGIYFFIPKSNLKQMLQLKIYSIISGLSSIAYGILFLPWFVTKYGNLDYSGFYKPAIESILNFLKTGDFVTLIKNLSLFGAAQVYLYQNFIIFDLPGILFLPLNVTGNYAERLLSSSSALVQPIYQYGVEVPIYSLSGILVIYIFMVYKNRLYESKLWVIFVLLNLVFGFASIVGWNKVYYSAYSVSRAYQNYKLSTNERDSFNEIIKLIPEDASLATATQYVPHLSTRKQISSWPETKVLSEIPVRSMDKKNNLDEFEYWLLPKNEGDYKITDLKNKNYRIIGETDIHILFKKPD